MLRKIEISLALPENKKINTSMGSILHGALMEIIGSAMAEKLHKEGTIRPFQQGVYFHRESQRAIWRLSSLSKEAEEGILEPVLKCLGQELCLRQKGYNIGLEAILKDERLSYEELADRIFLQEEGYRRGEINIISPLSFKQNGNYVIMPNMELLFQSLLKRWNTFSHSNVIEAENMAMILAEACRISSYKLRTGLFFMERGRIKGFQGSISLSFHGNDMLNRIIALLLSYSNFSGIGIKSALGMGMINFSLGENPRRRA